MAQSRTLCIGMDVHKDASAVASVAHDHGAEVPSCGALGTRLGDRAHLVWKRPVQAPHLLFLYAAGPWGSGLYRSRLKQGYAGGVVAPALMPQTSGDRVQTDRRDALPWARLARSGARTAVDVPPVAAEAMRDLTRARADTLRDLHDATGRRTAFGRRPDSRYPGRANGRPAHRRWRSAVGCPTPAPPSVLHAYVRAVQEPTDRLQRLAQALPEPVNAWRVSPGGGHGCPDPV